MNIYLCVYRQQIAKGWNKTWKEASVTNNTALKNYLRRYKKRFRKNNQNIGRFYDWGDDPAFFAAEEFLDDVHKASWGVCRPNVRTKLVAGDTIVFFCAQQHPDNNDQWEYYYVGLGTVGKILTERKKIWKEKCYAGYEEFFNLLIDPNGCHAEPIHPYHRDWVNRAKSPYVIFEASDKTHFNITNPLHVATYRKGEADSRKGKPLEVWRLQEDARVKRIYELIPKRGNGKKLRTSPTGSGHQHLNLGPLSHNLKETKRKLLKISIEIAEELQGEK